MIPKSMFRLCFAMAATAVMATGALAGPVWICSINNAVAVLENGETCPPDLGGLDRPTFLRVDIDAKTVTLLAPDSRRGEVSSALVVQEGGHGWMLSGVERGRAWSMVISNDGLMTLSMTGDGEVWAAFGHAIREDQLKAPDRMSGAAAPLKK